MYIIKRKQTLSDSVKLYEVEHPQLAQKARAGQFVIIRLKEGGERIPLTIADFDRDAGTITMVVQEVGKSTIDMDSLNEGDTILDVLGPLGHPSEIANYGKVLCIGGGLGVAPLYPITRELKKAGNRVISIMGARNKELLFWEDKMRVVSDELHVMTDDGSYGERGLVTHIQKKLLEGGDIDKIFAIGPAIMMKFVVETSRPFNVSTVVSLNTIMVDGTGMCGGCRVTVAGKQKFVCVDGPEFEGLEVDFNNLLNRQRYYIEEENKAMEYHRCKLESVR
ncbi:MAG: sulfide/dihydroorotate dehydrogenase-like FAD/NAD-binding protein [Deltaproteobacteria bacterium]|nr:sulfide/dihydroorotate dehydrogenase-like FAD/NAD-binding protein [Deltaproteobacteria bacterium]